MVDIMSQSCLLSLTMRDVSVMQTLMLNIIRQPLV